MDNYVKIKLLGQGSFGQVFLMREKKPGGRLVCIKQIHSFHTPAARGSPSSSPSTVMEVSLMKKLHHPNLIRFVDSFPCSNSSSKQKESQSHCIVMDYCPGGDLHAYIQQGRGRSGGNKKQITEDLVWFWFLQLCLGLHHMHQLHILHRDIKTSNIFLSNAGFLVLGDFGIARELQSAHDLANTVIGTPLYMALETLDGKPYSFASDIWALGCVLYEMCTGNPPFVASSTPALIRKICDGQFAPLSKVRFSSKLQELLAKMLTVDAGAHPTTTSILSDLTIHAHLKRYFRDRFSGISTHPSVQKPTTQAEEQSILNKQLQSLGVVVEAALGTQRQAQDADNDGIKDKGMVPQAAHQQVFPVFPQFGRASEDTESNAPSFLGIPRRGVPLTSHAKEFTSRSPVCEDVRVLRKQERAKAAEKYKQKLEALQNAPPIAKKVAAGVATPRISSKGAMEKQTDDAILHSMAELQVALSAMSTK
ncbi:Nek/nek1 protein kinase, partial [Globisporangium splendens]